MPIYRVKPGYLHGAGNQYKPGDTLTLTPFEAAGFLDKLELVESEPVIEADPPLPPVITLYEIDTALQDQPPAIPPIEDDPAPPPVEAKPKRGRKPKEVEL